MNNGKNRQQAKVDAVVRSVKARRLLIEVAQRGIEAPESLGIQEIKRMSAFVLAHGDCRADSKLDGSEMGAGR